jgi:predicted RNase H-like HicB family nuclease
MKVDIEDVTHTLHEQGFTGEQIKEVERRLKEAAEQAKAEKEKENQGNPKPEYQPILIAISSDPEAGRLINNTPFFVLGLDESLSHVELPTIIRNFVSANNTEATEKRKFGGKQPILGTIADFIEHTKTSAAKGIGIKLHIREPLLGVVIPSNDIPL